VLSVAGIILEEMDTGFIPINPTIIRVMRVLRIARGLSSQLAVTLRCSILCKYFNSIPYISAYVSTDFSALLDTLVILCCFAFNQNKLLINWCHFKWIRLTLHNINAELSVHTSHEDKKSVC